MRIRDVWRRGVSEDDVDIKRHVCVCAYVRMAARSMPRIICCVSGCYTLRGRWGI